jgi:hypothetical protein
LADEAKPMNGQFQTTPPTTKGVRRAKPLAAFGAALFVGLAMYCAVLPATRATAVVEEETRTPQAVAAANAFLDSLDSKERDQALLEFGSTRKSRWSNLPVRMVPRNGVRMGDLTAAQRKLAMEAIAAVLSKEGFQKVVNIVDADQKLAESDRRGRGPNAMFGADQYYLAFFGKPSAENPWMLQFGGHHLGLNVTVIGKHFVLTPTHTGAQPTLFERNGKEVRPLGVENDTAFKLINALDGGQKAKAILAKRPQQDLLVGPGRDGKKIDPQGIKGSALSAEQQSMLLDLIAAWVTIVEPEAAASRMAEIRSTLGDTYFAWMGPTTNGSAVYFRITGPSVVIEYAPQRGTGHIHTVIRNPNDDYGVAEIAR